MHIVFLTSEYPKKGYPHGGVGTVVQNIARGLVKHQYIVSVVGLNYNKSNEVENDHGVNIIRLSPKKVKYFSWYLNSKLINKAIAELHDKQPINIIECTEMGLAFVNKIKGVQKLIRLHGGHHFFAESEERKINPWKAFQEKRSFKKADHIIGVSEYVVKHTYKYINFKDKYKGVINNLANLDRFKPSDQSEEVKGRVFFAGSLCEKKGIRQLIKAMTIVIQAIPEAHLVVAGRDTKIRGKEESYLDYLKTEIEDNIREKIVFLGVVDNDKLSHEIEKAEVCVYPSHMETFGMSCIEAMSMGKCVITSKLGPGPEVVEHQKTGLLCNPFEIDKLANQIILLLEDGNYAHQLGINAINDIKQRFGYEHLMQKNITLYKTIIKKQ
jgi:glycosyltransferase involved in cell wall biosynthesis